MAFLLCRRNHCKLAHAMCGTQSACHRLLMAVLACVAALWVMLPGLAAAQTASVTVTGISEDRIEAAYLYKFLGYVEWPAAAFAKAGAPYVIGVAGADDIADSLVRMAAGKLVNNRPVAVKQLHPGDSISGLHVLFIGKVERAQRTAWLRAARGQPVLLVTGDEDAQPEGSMINFRLVDDHVRFDIALAPVEQSGLKLNSRLLTVAARILKAEPQ